MWEAAWWVAPCRMPCCGAPAACGSPARDSSIVALLACALLTFSAWFCADVSAIVLIISAGTFCAAVGNPCSCAITMNMGGDHVATVMSMMNMSGNLGAALFPLAVPWLLAATGSWNAVLLGFGGLYVAAAACWGMLKTEGTVIDQAWSRSGARPDA